MEDNKKTNEEVIEEVDKSTEENDTSVEVVEEVENQDEEVVEEPRNVITTNTTKFDFRTMKYLNVYIMKYKRKTFLIYLIFSIITLLVAIYTFVNSLLNSDQPDYVFPIIFTLFAAYMLYQGLTIEKSLDKQLVNFFKGKQITTQIIEFEEEYLYVSRGTSDEMGEAVKIDWASVNEIHELPQYVYLFIGNNPIVIDKDPETFSNGSSEEFTKLLNEKIAARKYKKIDKDIVKNPITYVHEEMVVEPNEVNSTAEENTSTEGSASNEAEETKENVEE